MNNEDLFRCPLLQGLDAMHRAELLALINDSNLRERLETCLAQLKAADLRSPGQDKETHNQSFDQKVHDWNPKLPIWTRSPKE